MIERIAIRDFAVAREVTFTPGPGLNAFTGETGAGKSLVVDALAFAFGSRKGREVIAHGAERATVEVTVTLPSGRHVVERTVGLSGRSTIRVDGESAALAALEDLGADLIDIHGQSGQLAILRPPVQLRALDEFASLHDLRREFAALVRDLRDLRRRIDALQTDARERERLVAQLAFETAEIDAAALVPGEDEALRADHLRL
ncbi:MAG TPA: AAA family ATPase, partial [Tepidiformaceae bacterium]|nr:AAA family ATPase [Tepidiformaceae bacterium]